MKNKLGKLIKLALLICMIGSCYIGRSQSLYVYDSTAIGAGCSGTIWANVSGGTAPYTYTLTGYSGTFNPITQASSIFTAIPPGSYNLSVTDANGLTGYNYAYLRPSFDAYISVLPALCPSTVGSEVIRIYLYDTIPLTYTYAWSNGSTTDSIGGVSVGSHYTCTVTASNGCVVPAYDSGGMYQSSSIVVTTTAQAPANCTNGVATVSASGGQSPYTYLWSNAQTGTTCTGLSAGYPTVTVTDAQHCTASQYVYIQQAITISTQINSTDEYCNSANGTLTASALNGTAPFTYQWSSGQTTDHITGLSSGTYDVLITDHNGCTAENYGWVQKSTPVSVTTTGMPTSCTSPTGTATALATGGTAPYTYTWTSVPPQTTATASGLPAGYYVVSVVDAVGCTQNQSVSIANNSTLAMSLSKTDVQCGGSPGQVTANVTGGSSPYTYLWNTGATSSSISGINQAGSYSCVVTDNVGCKVSHYVFLASQSPVSVSYGISGASCIYTADGSATMIASGGRAPYTYHWPNGQTLPTINGLLTGDYYGYAVDANGCASQGAWFHVGYTSIQPCAVTISGIVVNDMDSICQFNYYGGFNRPLPGVWVGCLPNGGYQWTDYAGAYTFTLPPGSYSLVQAPPLYHSTACNPSSIITLSAGQSSINNDFFDYPDTVRDLAINCVPYQGPRVGFTQHMKLFVRNLGNLDISPDVVFQHTSDVNFVSSNPAPTSYNSTTGKITWSGSLLGFNQTNAIDLYFSIPSTLPLGHILNNSDTVYPMTGDANVNNNFEDCQGIATGSFDPNYMDVLPKGAGSPGFISSTKDTTLRYVVHFQNTGTYTATYVTLKIPVDANLDISTFTWIGASHTVSSISADNNRMLTIKFENINLPDSSSDQLGSQGFAAFTFKLKRGLTPGTPISEMSNIYFDFNTPVPTGHTLNTIQYPAGIDEVTATSEMKVYPNPTTGNVTIDLSAVSESKVTVTVYDMSGRAMISGQEIDVTQAKVLKLNTSALVPGVYIIEANGTNRYIQKMVKTQ